MPQYDSEGHELSDYEARRLERIAKNEAYLESLGLGNAKAKLMAEITKRTKRNAARRKKRQDALRVKPGEERRSMRLSSAGGGKGRGKGKGDPSSELVMLSYEGDDGEEIAKTQDQDGDYEFERDGESFPVNDRPYRSRGYNVSRDDWELTEDEKSALERSVDENYLAKFKEFLVFHNKISEQNTRNVMKQVGKLARGDGIRYESKAYGWPEGCYFMRGTKITPTSDIVSLMEEAQECEDRWGRDHGNGWLLSHPLKKLLLFQQFALNNPDFLNARCKLGEYYALDDDLDLSTEAVTEAKELVEATCAPKKQDSSIRTIPAQVSPSQPAKRAGGKKASKLSSRTGKKGRKESNKNGKKRAAVTTVMESTKRTRRAL